MYGPRHEGTLQLHAIEELHKTKIRLFSFTNFMQTHFFLHTNTRNVWVGCLPPFLQQAKKIYIFSFSTNFFICLILTTTKMPS